MENNNNNNSKTLSIHTFAEEKTEVTYGRWNKKLSVKTGTWYVVGYTEDKEERIFQGEDKDLIWQIEADALSVYLAVKNAVEKFPELDKIIVKNTNYLIPRLKRSHTKAGDYLKKAKEIVNKKNIELILKWIPPHNNIATSNTEKLRYLL